MKLSKLKLMNYRCFGPEEQVIHIGKLTTFIGNNSAGKTAALSALNCLFSENSSDRILRRSDFHLPKEIRPDEMQRQELYIEAVFEFEELKTATGGEYEKCPEEKRGRWAYILFGAAKTYDMVHIFLLEQREAFYTYSGTVSVG